MQNYRIPKPVATTTVKGASKGGRPRKRWRDVVEEDLNMVGIKTGRRLSEAVGNVGRLYWKPRAQRTVVLGEE
jgi:hypothetical protein